MGLECKVLWNVTLLKRTAGGVFAHSGAPKVKKETFQKSIARHQALF